MTLGIPRRKPRAGFTLVEVLVALTLAAVVAVVARAMGEVIGVTEKSIGVATLERDRLMNAERHLRSLALRAVVNDAQDRRFVGRPDSVSFASFCDTRGGWQEVCRVSMSLSNENGRWIVLHRPGEQPAMIPLPEDAALRYLLSAPDRWVDAWDSGITMPLAIGISGATRRVVLRIGARG